MADNSYDQDPLVRQIATNSSELIVDSFWRNRTGIANTQSCVFSTRLNATPTSAIEVNYQNILWDGVLYAHTWQNCMLSFNISGLSDAAKVDGDDYTAMLTPYVAYNSPDGYSAEASPSVWHECLEGSYGADLQAALRAVYSGLPPDLIAKYGGNLLQDNVLQANQPFPLTKVWYKPGVGFAIQLIGEPGSLATSFTAFYAESNWLQNAHWTHGFGRWIADDAPFGLGQSQAPVYYNKYTIGYPAVGLSNIPYFRNTSMVASYDGVAADSIIFGYIADHEPFLAPTRYVSISCPELSKRRTIPPSSNISTQAQGSNNLAIFHYNYRTAGRLNEIEDYAREYSHIRVNFSQEAPQELTIRMRDEFGNLITNYSAYGLGDSAGYLNRDTIGQVLPTSSTNRYSTTDFKSYGFNTFNLSLDYYSNLYGIWLLHNIRDNGLVNTYYPPPTNALCTTSDFIHLLVLRSS